MTEDRRPKPEFGEYAPEGWDWKPEGAETPAGVSADTSGATGGAPSPASPGSGRLSGVPHNLGTKTGDAAAAPAQAPASPPAQSPQTPGSGTNAPGAPAPYRAASPTGTASAPRAPIARGSKPNMGDRVVTVILLVIGALGALYSAASLHQLPASFEMMAAALDLDGFAAPSSMSTLGTVGALIILAIYALTLVFSIQRLRKPRITFWVPLVASALALIVMLTISVLAMNQVPELVEAMSAPDATSKMLDYVLNVAP